MHISVAVNVCTQRVELINIMGDFFVNVDIYYFINVQCVA